MLHEYAGSLHNHTEYSNLRLRDSINRYTEMIDYAIELGHKGIAFTEHESISNAIKIEKYYNKIKKEHPDFKVILGNEIYLCRDGLNTDNFISGEDKYWHFILLAKDATGHQQIRELSTRAWKRSYVAQNMRRVPTYYQDLIEVIGANPGHVIGSTACLGGFLDNQLLKYHENQDMNFYEKIVHWVDLMRDLFQDNFYLELQPEGSKEQQIVNQLLVELGEVTGTPYIITTDSHYLKKEDAFIHKAYLNSQDGDREVDSFYATTYMMGTEEIENLLSIPKDKIHKAYQNIENIMDMCEDYSLLKSLNIPSLKWVEPEYTDELQIYNMSLKIPFLETFLNSSFKGDQILAKIIINKILKDKTLQNKETYDEINNNLDAIWESSEVNKTHWSSYFLNLQKIIEVCWSAGTLIGPGRGSGVGFLILYILGITQINPLRETTRTFQWRFLNPERVSVLDVDIDIEGSRRAQILQALREEYGEERVANVVTFGTEKSKSAIQTAARGLGIDVDTSLYIASLIPADRGMLRTLKQCYYGDKDNDFAPIPLFVREMDQNPELWEVAQRIEGLVSRVGEHAGGVIFVDEPFTNSTALMRVPNGDLVTQFDLHDCEDASQV